MLSGKIQWAPIDDCSFMLMILLCLFHVDSSALLYSYRSHVDITNTEYSCIVVDCIASNRRVVA